MCVMVRKAQDGYIGYVHCTCTQHCYVMNTAKAPRPFSLAGHVHVKELTLSSGIGSHDLDTKLRQIQTWLSKNCHVRLTLREGAVTHTQPLVRTVCQVRSTLKKVVGRNTLFIGAIF